MIGDGSSTNIWSKGDSYESFVGRWSRRVAGDFLTWLALPDDGQWLDVGCGTGALSEALLIKCKPRRVKGVDRSGEYIESIRGRIRDPRAEFEVGDAQTLPLENETYDGAFSGLVLNFIPQPGRMVAEMARAVRTGGTVALYVWDYADKMQLMRIFWDSAVALDPAAEALDEGKRFPICHPDRLSELFRDAGLRRVEARSIDIPTVFKNFDDYWSPFLGGQGPASGYAMSLNEARRTQLRERIRSNLPIATDGSISLAARAWAVKGTK